jgi:hypothetical protein
MMPPVSGAKGPPECSGIPAASLPIGTRAPHLIKIPHQIRQSKGSRLAQTVSFASYRTAQRIMSPARCGVEESGIPVQAP